MVADLGGRIKPRAAPARGRIGDGTMDELIGWGSAAILVPAFFTQTYRQWQDRDRPVAASSLWFFVLVLIGTGGQVVYSWLVGNKVYLALNAVLVLNNLVGLGIAIHRWREARSRPDPAAGR